MAVAFRRLALAALGARGFRVHGGVLLALLLVQIGLGIANVLLRLPLAMAVAHNAGAALLLVALVVLNFTFSPKPLRSPCAKCHRVLPATTRPRASISSTS